MLVLSERRETKLQCLERHSCIYLFRLTCPNLLWALYCAAAKVLASRRVASQRTHELSEGVVATLDSPGTRTWGQVLGEVRIGMVCKRGSMVNRLQGPGLFSG